MTKTKHIIFLLILLICVNLLLEYNKNVKITNYLLSKTKQYKQNYDVHYKGHKKISEVIFKTTINKHEIKQILKKTINADKKEKDAARVELYNKLRDTYTFLKSFDIKQLHFHLPNNESFLRFHKPNKYGENLSNIRATVKYVNTHKQAIDGFEEGRIYNGFRFVFPLFLETTYLGSVEVSMSTFSMNVEMMQDHNLIGKFLILKSVVDQKVLEDEQGHYQQSQLENFLFEKSISKQIKAYNKKGIKIAVSEDVKKAVKENIDSDISFSMYDKESDTIMSFLKVQNPVSKKVVGMFVFRSDPFYINQQQQITFFLQGLVSLLLITMYIFIRRKAGERQKLATLVHEKTKELVSSKNKMSKYINLIDKYIITSSTDLNGTITDVSQAFCNISGYTKEELIGKPHNIVRHPDMPKTAFEDMWETIKKQKTWHGEVKNKKKSGGYYWVDATIESSYDESGAKIGYTSIRQDITDKKLIEEISITDGLTNLYNRRHFNEVFPKVINSAKRENRLLSFLIMDIDYFKQYNDTYGHQMGDDVLIKVAKALKQLFHRADDYCFRLGGEEFGIIFKVDSQEKAKKHVADLRETIENLQIKHEQNSVSPYITASIGLISKPVTEISNEDEIYKEVDDLLYKAKESGRNRVCS